MGIGEGVGLGVVVTVTVAPGEHVGVGLRVAVCESVGGYECLSSFFGVGVCLSKGLLVLAGTGVCVDFSV